MERINYKVWKEKALADRFLSGVRGALPLAKEQFDVVLKLIEMNRKPVRSFLDLGSGDGIMSSVILSAYPEAKGVLLDISEYMIAAAREKLDEFKYNLSFTVFDYSDSAWTGMVRAGAPYDVIVSGLSIHHQPDERKKEIYREIFGLLDKGGLFINLEHVASPTKWVSSLFSETFTDSLFEMNKKKNTSITREAIAKEMYNRPDKESNILSPVGTQCDWLRSIGFEDVDCYFKIYEIAIFGGRKPK
ncbi:MAG TPA: class I SAM-dependent methyltransferase [Clostridia bacterium]|nr:class I SAM-dependent methyltransferase [Clostridia bacterium]